MAAYRREGALFRVEVLSRGSVDEAGRVDQDHVRAEAVLHADVDLAGVERPHGILLQSAVLRFDVSLSIDVVVGLSLIHI